MPVVDPRIAGKPVPRVSKETMEHECVARVKNVKALDVAFLDQRIPRYERDIINMVGMGRLRQIANRYWRRLPEVDNLP
ncbi:MAG: hypothetical protein WAV78_06515 [Xanthobacteraceae bacterium]